MRGRDDDIIRLGLGSLDAFDSFGETAGRFVRLNCAGDEVVSAEGSGSVV